MIERIIILENIDPIVFYGINNCNIQLIKTLFPKLRFTARGMVIKVIGDENETAIFESKIKQLEKYCAEYNILNEEIIIDIIKGQTPICCRKPARCAVRRWRGTRTEPPFAAPARNVRRSFSEISPILRGGMPWTSRASAPPWWHRCWKRD